MTPLTFPAWLAEMNVELAANDYQPWDVAPISLYELWRCGTTPADAALVAIDAWQLPGTPMRFHPLFREGCSV